MSFPKNTAQRCAAYIRNEDFDKSRGRGSYCNAPTTHIFELQHSKFFDSNVTEIFICSEHIPLYVDYGIQMGNLGWTTVVRRIGEANGRLAC